MILRRGAPEPERLGPFGLPPSVSLGAGEPASDSFDEVRDRCTDCRFLGAGLEGAGTPRGSGRSEEGGSDLGGNASEPRLDGGGSDGVGATGGSRA